MAEAALGHVDILINNAGAGASGPTADTTEAAFDGLFALNVKVPTSLTAALAPGAGQARRWSHRQRLDDGRRGFGLDGMALYGSTKAALELLTKAWSAGSGLMASRVNANVTGSSQHRGHRGMQEAQGYLASLA